MYIYIHISMSDVQSRERRAGEAGGALFLRSFVFTREIVGEKQRQLALQSERGRDSER
jgi:hypothetical protein